MLDAEEEDAEAIGGDEAPRCACVDRSALELCLAPPINKYSMSPAADSAGFEVSARACSSIEEGREARAGDDEAAAGAESSEGEAGTELGTGDPRPKEKG